MKSWAWTNVNGILGIAEAILMPLKPLPYRAMGVTSCKTKNPSISFVTLWMTIGISSFACYWPCGSVSNCLDKINHENKNGACENMRHFLSLAAKVDYPPRRIMSKNSALFLVAFILSRMNSIASISSML